MLFTRRGCLTIGPTGTDAVFDKMYATELDKPVLPLLMALSTMKTLTWFGPGCWILAVPGPTEADAVPKDVVT